MKASNAFLSMSIYLLEHAMGRKESPKARFSSFLFFAEVCAYLLTERPGQESIIVTLHHNKEERYMGALPDAITIQIYPGAHLVAKAASVERLAVQA